MADKKTEDISATDKINEKLDVLLEMSCKMQKQLEKGECKILNFNDAADYLGCSHSYLYKLSAAGVITSHKPCRRLYFFQDELDDWVKGKTTNKKGGTIESNK